MPRDFFILCEKCNHKKLLFEVLNQTGEELVTQIENAKKKALKMRCSHCNALGEPVIRSLEITAPKRIEIKYEVSVYRNIFHRSTCGLLANTSNDMTIKFGNREDAVAGRFDPCENCRP